jgi:hypothetical protein
MNIRIKDFEISGIYLLLNKKIFIAIKVAHISIIKKPSFEIRWTGYQMKI